MEVISSASSFLADIRGTRWQEQQGEEKVKITLVHYLNRRIYDMAGKNKKR